MSVETTSQARDDWGQMSAASLARASGRGPHAAYASQDEMLEPGVLASILGRPVESVRREPRTVEESSTGAVFETIHLDGEAGASLISKTVERDRDWVAIATYDGVDREVRTWESGILGRLPGPAAHAVVAGARTESGYTVLMQDLSDHLLPSWSPIPDAEQALVLEAMASMHATFWMDPSLEDPFHGLSSLSSWIGHGAPRTMERLRLRMGPVGIADWIEAGWEKLPSVVDPQLADDLRAIADDPTLVVESMRDLPWTLVHSDLRPANTAVELGSQSAYFLDWARPCLAPPAMDMLYWLFTANSGVPDPRDELIEMYASALERRLGSRFSSDWWDRQLDLCFVAFVACFVPIMTQTNAEATLGWTDRCRPGLRALR